MDVNKRTRGRAVSMPVGLSLGAAVSLGTTLLAAFVLARLLDSERMTWENAGYGILFLLLLSSFAGAMTAYHKIKRKRMIVCMSEGGIYFAMLMAITALFFGGQYEAVGVTAGLVFAGSAAAGLLGLAGSSTKQGHKLRKVHR